ncbi:MAG: hypothetical protein HDR06_15990 [Lachnospiraceae bacterium]|nr:hypothetical protein [Lachnospiraceae bacterium]
MMENVAQFIKDYMPQLVGTGLGFGWFIGFVAELSGYAVGKVQGMIGCNE